MKFTLSFIEIYHNWLNQDRGKEKDRMIIWKLVISRRIDFFSTMARFSQCVSFSTKVPEPNSVINKPCKIILKRVSCKVD